MLLQRGLHSLTQQLQLQLQQKDWQWSWKGLRVPRQLRQEPKKSRKNGGK